MAVADYRREGHVRRLLDDVGSIASGLPEGDAARRSAEEIWWEIEQVYAYAMAEERDLTASEINEVNAHLPALEYLVADLRARPPIKGLAWSCTPEVVLVVLGEPSTRFNRDGSQTAPFRDWLYEHLWLVVSFDEDSRLTLIEYAPESGTRVAGIDPFASNQDTVTTALTETYPDIAEDPDDPGSWVSKAGAVSVRLSGGAVECVSFARPGYWDAVSRTALGARRLGTGRWDGS
jgi:hypothetical protein